MVDPATLGRELVVAGEHVLVPFQGEKQFLVESRSRPGEHHNVSWEFNDETGKDEWTCVCESFTFRHDCRHVRAVDLWAAGLATVKIVPADVSAERIAEWVRNAEKVLAAAEPADHPLWKPWALDLADQVLALAAERVE